MRRQSPTHATWLDTFRHILLGTAFQSGAQFIAGELVISVFFWRSGLRSRIGCLLSTLYILNSLLVPTDNTMGSKFAASAVLLGSTWLGSLLAGSIMSIARQDDTHGMTTVLCVLAAVTLVPVAVIRASPNHVVAKGFGIFTSIVFAVVLVNGQFLWPKSSGPRIYWHQNVTHMLLNGTIAATTAAVSSFLVLPSLAGDAVLHGTASALRQIGSTMSEYSSLMFHRHLPTGPPHQQGSTTGSDTVKKLNGSNVTIDFSRLEEDGEDWEYQACLHALSHPKRGSQKAFQGSPLPKGLTALPSAARVRPLLTKTKMALGKTVFEPAWLQRAPLAPPAWGRVFQSLEVLVTQVSGWEALLDEKQRLEALLDTGLGPQFRAAVRPQLAQLSGHVAAQCARLADAVEGRLPLHQATCVVMSGLDHEALQHKFHEAANGLMGSYWSSFQQQGTDVNSPAELAPALQVRALAFNIMLQRGVMASLHQTELALAAALGQTLSLPNQANPEPKTEIDIEAPADRPAGAGHNSGSAPEKTGTYWVGKQLHQPSQSAGEPATTALDPATAGPETLRASVKDPAPTHTFKHMLSNVLSSGPLAGGVQHTAPKLGWHYYLGFAQALIMVILAVPSLTWLAQATATFFSTAVKHPKQLRAYAVSRQVQFGLKYWLCVSGLTVAALVLQQDWIHGRRWTPFYAVITAPIVFNERVEASLSKGFIRIAGTAAGGILAYLVMLKPVLATRSVPLAAILLPVNFVVACFGHTQFKTSIVLTMTAFNAGILCQFVGCCGSHGTIHYYVQQVIPIAVAVGWVAVVNTGLRPWYASTEGLDLLARAFEQSALSLQTSHSSFVKAAAAAAGKQEPATQEQHAAPSQAGPGSNNLNRLVAAPLGQVQAMLATDAAPWSFQKLGLLVMPPVLHETLAVLLPLLDRLEGLALTSSQGPFLSGSFHGQAYYEHFAQPLDAAWRGICADCVTLSQLAAALLRNPDASVAQKLADAIAAFVQQRAKLRSKFQQQRKALHLAMSTDDECKYSLDDSCRLQSHLFAMLKVLDKVTQAAKVVHAHQSKMTSVLAVV